MIEKLIAIISAILASEKKGTEAALKIMARKPDGKLADQGKSFALCLYALAIENPKLTLLELLEDCASYNPREADDGILSFKGLFKDFGKSILIGREAASTGETKAQKDEKIETIKSFGADQANLLCLIALAPAKKLSPSKKAKALEMATAATDSKMLSKIEKGLKLKS